ncbi:MAG: ArsR/SmtB family transcription factor [Candidatus Baltobacteraceae bacterium]
MVSNIDSVFSALADPTRRRIVERLARRPLTIGQIASQFPISQPAISKHVRVLELAGVLQRTVEGRVHYCTISPQAMQEVSTWIDRQSRYWNGALDRLERLLAKQSNEKRKS